MKGTKKTPKVPGFMRTILSANLAALVDKHFAHLDSITARQKALASEAKVSFSTVQRLMGGDTGATLDNIEAVAAAFDLSAYQVLIPGLNVNNPQVVKGATEDEQRLYVSFRKERARTRTAERVSQ